MDKKRYSARFRAIQPYTKSKKTILLISIGQEYYEGPKFESIIELINTCDFESCTVMIAGILQRHNYMNSMTEKLAIEAAINNRNSWMERNKRILSKLEAPNSIVYWDEHLANKDFFIEHLNMLKDAYAHDVDIKTSIDRTIEKYFIRRHDILANHSQDLAFKNCLNYILEECVILMPMWASQGYDYIIYPKKMTDAMQMMHKKFVLKQYPDKVRWLPVRFSASTTDKIEDSNNYITF